MNNGTRAYVVAAALVVAHAAYRYPGLPDPVAWHFGADGAPNGWVRPAVFAASNVGVVALIGAAFVGIGAVLGRIPWTWVSLPNRDYWLAPERRDWTLAFVADRMAWFAAWTALFVLVVAEITVRANHRPDPRLPGAFWWVYFAYLGSALVWAGWMIVRFARKPR